MRGFRYVAVSSGDRILLVVLDAEYDAALIGRLTEHGMNRLALTVVFVGFAVVDTNFRALIVGARDDVDHTGDRVGTVHGGGAVVQYFDALDDSHWQQVQILQLRRNTMTVDQQQCAVGTQTAQ